MIRDIRPKAFAITELFLDLVHAARAYAGDDLETALIFCSINEATMRPLLLDPKTPAEAKLMPKAPEEYRGSISMLLVAERVGLPRETVRRKTKALIKAGLVFEDEDGRVRAEPMLMTPVAQKVVKDSFAAVRRYDKRLRQLGVGGVGRASKDE
ncbi:MAG TPA: winged helix-turn-helix domain-containing protein [Hyphomonadaceae bacterium]|nr:winged helix-turn-helix domain-containing protein [Hyphomonadaceae bacterium]